MNAVQPKPDSVEHVNVNFGGERIPGNSPRNWPWLLKHIILLQCGFLAACPGLTSSMLIPGVKDIAQQFNVSVQMATYLIAVHVLFLGLAPFVWNPLMNSYGRRPVLILSTLLSCFAALGGGYAKSYGGLMTARVFQSISISCGFVVPGVIVVDIFSPEERGHKNGIWTQMVALGAPLGGIIGGPIVHYVGWRWVMYIIAIFNSVQFVGFVFSCPETSYVHRLQNGFGAYRTLELFRIPKRLKGQFGLRSFVEPLLFLQSKHVTLIALAYGVTFAITSPGIAVILPLALDEVYSFGAIAQGAFFTGPLVGILLAELIAGRASDWIMRIERRRAAQANRPQRLESRLLVGLLGYCMSPIGVIIFGVTLQTHKHWVAPCIGFAISNFGLQLITTPLKTYCVDCYSTHSGSVLQLINFIRQVISFTVPFWSPDLNTAVGYGLGFGIEAIILVVFYVASMLVFWKGPSWRQSGRVRGLRK